MFHFYTPSRGNKNGTLARLIKIFPTQVLEFTTDGIPNTFDNIEIQKMLSYMGQSI